MVTSSRWNEAKLRLANMNPVRQTVGGQTTTLIHRSADGGWDRGSSQSRTCAADDHPPSPPRSALRPAAESGGPAALLFIVQTASGRRAPVVAHALVLTAEVKRVKINLYPFGGHGQRPAPRG